MKSVRIWRVRCGFWQGLALEKKSIGNLSPAKQPHLALGEAMTQMAGAATECVIAGSCDPGSSPEEKLAAQTVVRHVGQVLQIRPDCLWRCVTEHLGTLLLTYQAPIRALMRRLMDQRQLDHLELAAGFATVPVLGVAAVTEPVIAQARQIQQTRGR
jgi:hypothetical protein